MQVSLCGTSCPIIFERYHVISNSMFFSIHSFFLLGCTCSIKTALTRLMKTANGLMPIRMTRL